ncbi:hypothetical protein GCM10008096_09710 [Zhihengliuella salsuginis]|uniref:DUF6318 domain-containing protein n=1 Tax=Zhihengliuella salsuginis TaxID=578222 RepID=A0ABQ3GEE1_9MICC|nr:hypothetical protein GCM10008096_09710 [Zhihengliuella salsuginis]
MSPIPKPATSSSPAENLDKPQMPELATEFSGAGFEAFIEYWFEARNYAVATGDTEFMLEVSDSRCGYCLQHQQGIDEIYGAGGWVVGGELIPSDFGKNLQPTGGGAYHSFFTLRQTRGAAYSTDGELLEGYTFTPGDYDYEFFAFHEDATGWTAALIDLADGSK